VADAASGTLPNVVFYKPQGDLTSTRATRRSRPATTNIATSWRSSRQAAILEDVIVITYDENAASGTTWRRRKGDKLGPRARASPRSSSSPLAKKGFVDHTAYDTASGAAPS